MLVGDVVGLQLLVEEVDFFDRMLFWLPAVDFFEFREFFVNDRSGVDGYTSENLRYAMAFSRTSVLSLA